MDIKSNSITYSQGNIAENKCLFTDTGITLKLEGTATSATISKTYTLPEDYASGGKIYVSAIVRSFFGLNGGPVYTDEFPLDKDEMVFSNNSESDPKTLTVSASIEGNEITFTWVVGIMFPIVNNSTSARTVNLTNLQYNFTYNTVADDICFFDDHITTYKPTIFKENVSVEKGITVKDESTFSDDTTFKGMIDVMSVARAKSYTAKGYTLPGGHTYTMPPGFYYVIVAEGQPAPTGIGYHQSSETHTVESTGYIQIFLLFGEITSS